MALTTIFVVALVLGIVLSKKAASKTKLSVPEKLMKKYANQLSTVYGIKIDSHLLSDATTPQYTALSWVVHQELFLDDDFNTKDYSAIDGNGADDAKAKKPTREASEIVTPEMVERYILAVFYYATRGDKWRQNNFWLSRESMCLWDGVQCSGNFTTATIAPTRLDHSATNTSTRPQQRRSMNGIDGDGDDEVQYYGNDVFSVEHLRSGTYHLLL